MSSFMDESTYVEEPEVVDGTPQIPRFGWSDSENISCAASETELFSVVTAPISEVDTSVVSRKSKKNPFEISSDRRSKIEVSDEEFLYIQRKKTPIIFRIMKSVGREKHYKLKNTIYAWCY